MYSEIILKLLAAHSNSTGLAQSTISTYASGSGDYLGRLKDGKVSITERRATKIIQWFSDNWPVDAFWPHDIPRPAPAPDSPAGSRTDADARAPASRPWPLDENGHILNLSKFCRENVMDAYVARRVINEYGYIPRVTNRYPALPTRSGTGSFEAVRKLARAGDARFAHVVISPMGELAADPAKLREQAQASGEAA